MEQHSCIQLQYWDFAVLGFGNYAAFILTFQLSWHARCVARSRSAYVTWNCQQLSMEYFQLDRTALVFRGWQLTPAQILCIGLKLINCGPQQENSHRR